MSGARVAEVVLADDPVTWGALGFAVDAGGAVALGGVALRLAGRAAGEGLLGLALDGAPAGAGLDGVARLEPGPPPAPATHPNGACAIDHVVVRTPSVPRTVRALRAAGLDLRATRDVPVAPPAEAVLQQAFLLAGACVVEVVGPPRDVAAAGEDATLWGVTLVVRDLDALARRLGPRLGPVRDAVQPGRRIATLPAEAGVACPVAVMTPRR